MGQGSMVKNIVKNANLYNLSNKMYEYLVLSTRKEKIDIKDTFYFDGFKEFVKNDLILFNTCYDSLNNGDNSDEINILLTKKAKLRSAVEEILSSDQLLTNFTIFKIQQFINSLVNSINSNPNYDKPSYFKNYSHISLRGDKYLLFDGVQFDITRFNSYPVIDELSKFLYSEFDLNFVRLEEYIGTFKMKLDNEICQNKRFNNELNRYLFSVGTSVEDNNSYSYTHPKVNIDILMDYLRTDSVAKRIKNKKMGLKVCGENFY